MEIEKLIDQAKNWIGSRLQNPYFGSVIAIWLFTNRVVIFGIFNFDKDLSLNQRVEWIHHEFESFHIWHFHGFEASLLFSVILAFPVMLFLNKLSGLGEFLYKWADRGTINFIKRVEPANWVERKGFEELERVSAVLEEELRTRKADIARLEKENDSMVELVSKNKTEVPSYMSQISDLKKEVESKNDLIKQKDDLLSKWNIDPGTYEKIKTQIQNSLKIIKAEYFTKNHKIDLTKKVRDQVKKDTLDIIASNEIGGDPDPGVKKKLRLKYKIGYNSPKSKTYKEGERIRLGNLEPLKSDDDF